MSTQSLQHQADAEAEADAEEEEEAELAAAAAAEAAFRRPSRWLLLHGSLTRRSVPLPGSAAERVARLFNSQLFGVLVVILTALALFLVDVSILASDGPQFDSAVAWIIFGCFAFFLLEIAGSIWIQDGYFLSVFFVCDVIGTLSLLFDIPFIIEPLGITTTSIASASAAALRASRIARTATRATRVLRLLRAIRMPAVRRFRCWRSVAQTETEKEEEEEIAAAAAAEEQAAEEEEDAGLLDGTAAATAAGSSSAAADSASPFSPPSDALPSSSSSPPLRSELTRAPSSADYSRARLRRAASISSLDTGQPLGPGARLRERAALRAAVPVNGMHSPRSRTTSAVYATSAAGATVFPSEQQQQEQEEQQQRQETNVGLKLQLTVSKRVIVLVTVMIFVIPLLSEENEPDRSRLLGLHLLESVVSTLR